MSIVKQLVQRADSWVNAMTGLGTLRDKLMHAQVVAGMKLEDHTLEALYNDDDVARRVVAKLPREATRRGFKIELEGDPDETAPADVARSMQEAFTKLEAMPKLRDGWIWARLYGGGSGVFVGADDGRPVEEPLNEQAIRTISFLNVVKRPQLAIKRRYEDVRLAEYGQPEIYTINQTSNVLAPRTGIEVHASRLILFDGALTARMTMESPTGFDDSVLQSAMAPLQQTATAWQSVAHLMTDASQGVLKIANLVDLVATGGSETLRARVQLMDLARSVCRAILVDAERESFERVSTSFAGLPEVMDRLMMRMAAAAEMPVTLLYGRSPAGLNATGESDIRGWYDTVAEGQTDELKPRLERLLRLMFAAKDSPTRGRVPENWCIEFNPLWQPTDKERADTKKVTADTYVALVGAQIMTDAEAGLGLAADFPTIDVESRMELAEADAEEGLRPREVNQPPLLEPGEDDPDDPDDDASKPRGDSGEPRGDGNQPRVPAGSSRGGQWTSSGGGGRSSGAAGDRFTEAQRRGIAQSFATGKNAAVVAMQQKLVQRYGVPIEKAALMYERDIKAQLKAAKAARAEARVKAKAVLTKKKESASTADVDAHEAKLKTKYGDAARTVAWGRAMHDRGAAIEVEDFHAGMQALYDKGVTGFWFKNSSAVRVAIESTPGGVKTVGELSTALKRRVPGKTGRELAAHVEGASAVLAHRRALEASGAARTQDIPLKKLTHTKRGANYSEEQSARAVDNARKRYDALSHKDLAQPTNYDFIADHEPRAECEAKAMGVGFTKDRINIGAGRFGATVEDLEKTVMHEWGHALEAENPSRLARASAYYSARTKGEPLKHMGAGYKPHEMTREDKFKGKRKYMGKDYVAAGRRYATELTSMGAQELTSSFKWGDLYRDDRDSAHFTLGQLANQ